jgi:Glycosyl hydrolases family 39
MNVPPSNRGASIQRSKDRGFRLRFGNTKIKTVALLGITILLTGTLLIVFISQNPQQRAQHTIRLGNTIIDYTSALVKLDPLAFGMDISGYGYPNVFANDAVEQQKLKTLGIQFMRMDLKYSISGDPASKIICSGDGCDTRWTGDQWVQAIKAIGAQPLIIVPYRTVDAVNMLKHFNRDTNDYVRYWIVGNEPDLAGISAATYSTNFNRVYDAMKAIDPTIKIGGGVTAAYNAPFLQTFLQRSGRRVDFVDFHGYAQEGIVPGDYTTLFHIAEEYGNSITNLRSLIQQIVPARTSQIGIEVGEWELNWGGTAQNNINFHAVWVASVLGNILKAGGRSLFYADKGNAIYGSPHTFTDAYGHVVNIKPDDANPAYYGIGMYTGEGLFRGFGSTMVSASTTLPNIEVFASDYPKNIVVINTDQSLTQTATFSLKGVASGTVAVWRKDESVLFPNPPIKLSTLPLEDGMFTYQLPPFSVTTFVLNTASQPSSTLSLSPT